ncbi:hypothetical protein [Sulfuracidifex tepidarius]|uniref:Uncharacterized protein n=1 Tax=Sulfuracidifex tepidarius TaxID=1294262 RepID=A0A510E1E7_9CREN|nr:hypothetical protein [Sulfuracidifex tepidarius]BBG23169.1 hypothetical protein IC006_0453 [Sulfuracidifex tepidarius]BBG25918.1 hypothetical protein IC007_0423 [Sulfuracidifex tepidarius]
MSQSVSLYDIIAKAVSQAKRERLNPTQVNNMLEFSQSTDNVNDLLIFIMRQASRNHFVETAKILVKYLKDKDIMKAREFLGLFKWSFEALNETQSNFDNFSSMVNSFVTSTNTESGKGQGRGAYEHHTNYGRGHP